MSSLISVIVPAYNVEDYLVRCVDSILAQTYKNLEIILVDDGSKDSSGKLCDVLAQKDERIRVIHKANGGLSSARNTGMEAATGEYLAFVDSDDWIEPEAYQWMMELAEKYDVPMVCAGRYDADSDTGEKTVGLCPLKEEVISGQELARRIFHWENIDSAAWDKLYKAELFRNYRYPEGKIVEDVPVTFHIALDAGRIAMCNKPVYNYFHRPGSITTSSVSEKIFHFPGHTEQVYAYIREKCPAIEPEARYLRVRSLAYTLQTLEINEGDARVRFAEQYRMLRRELKKHTGFVISSPLFSRKEKRDNLLMIFDLYRGFRSVYHRIKG